ncbi:MAG TPA: lytic transglycosylase domain-containing protein, partial [Rhizomicrobium sp.]|nr:lytic transglycosylase domain-containing protein [Rhizomicrobium sp.]
MKKHALLIAAAVATLAASPAFAQSVPMAVLSPADVQRYRQIFADEDSGNFSDAQTLVSQLDDKSLIGYAQAEHYLSPYSSRTPVSELVDWLNANRDLPIADRIYALAVKRASVPIKRHHRIIGMRVIAEVPLPAAPPRRVGGGYEDADLPDPPLSSDIAKQAMAQMLPLVKADQPAQADTILQATVTQDIPGADVARLSQKVAASYLAEGQDFNAFEVQGRVNGIDRMTAPMLDWIAGLAAYRLGKFDVAGDHFEILAQNGAVPSWTRSQAAFWAARARIHSGDSLKAITLLVAATREEPTFYGLLAEKILGFDTESGFADPVLDAADFNAIAANPCAHRAVALYQIGQSAPLHEEMARALTSIDYKQAGAFAAMARQMNQPDLELRASELAAGRGKTLTGLFPVPAYQPAGGYHIDSSLILAFARIESHFQANAVSPVGARGLMQIMPGTAAHLEHGSVAMAELNDPSVSLDLGQRYLTELIDQMNGNLFEIAAGYNSGPGNVYRWMDRPGVDKNDPLLFIESMPSPETRNYVKRVMTYYWMYNRRQNQSQPTLDQSAEGKWPKYERPYSAPMPPPPQQTPAATNT